MPGISRATATVLQDPFAIVLALFILGGLASHRLFQEYPIRRAIVRVIFLILLTIAFAHTGIVPFRPTQPTGNTLHDAVHVVLKIAWLWAAWFLVALVRAFVVSEPRPHEGKLIQDLLAGVIYLAAVFAIIAYVLDLPVQGLLATSGAIAIVLGLALQSTPSGTRHGAAAHLLVRLSVLADRGGGNGPPRSFRPLRRERREPGHPVADRRLRPSLMR